MMFSDRLSVLFFDPVRFSVWCFFASLSSVVVYLFILSRQPNAEAGTAPA